MALAQGSRLGPYEVTALIDSGGIGDVYQGSAGSRMDSALSHHHPSL